MIASFLIFFTLTLPSPSRERDKVFLRGASPLLNSPEKGEGYFDIFTLTRTLPFSALPAF